MLGAERRAKGMAVPLVGGDADRQSREWAIAESEFQRGYAAGRSSERESLATAIKGIRHNAHYAGGTIAFQVWVMERCDELLAALEEAG